MQVASAQKPFAPWPVHVAYVPEDEALGRRLAAAIAATGNHVKTFNLNDSRSVERLLLFLHPLLVLLSPAALRSSGCSEVLQRSWHFQAHSHPPFLLLLVLAAPFEETDQPAFLAELPCIALPNGRPCPPGEAVQRTLQVLGLTAGTPALDDPSLEALLLRGRVLWRLDREEEAISCFEVATQRAPSSFSAWYNLGASLGRTPGREEEAIAAFESALAIEPHSGHAWEWLGSLYKDVGRLEDKKRAYEQMLICGDEHYPHWEARAHILHYELERYAEALDAYDRIVQEYPGEVFMYFGMGEALCALGRYEEALAAFDRYLKDFSDDADALYDKGVALYELERYEEALVLSHQALWAYWDEEDVDIVGLIETWFQKGEVLLALDRYEEALEAYDHILVFCPTSDAAWHSRALALCALGREEEAQIAEAYAQKET